MSITRWIRELIFSVIADERFEAFIDKRVDRITDRILTELDERLDSLPLRIAAVVDVTGDKIREDVNAFIREQVPGADQIADRVADRIGDAGKLADRFIEAIRGRNIPGLPFL